MMLDVAASDEHYAYYSQNDDDNRRSIDGAIMKKQVRVTSVSMTCTGDGRDHWIRDELPGGARSSGRYRAVCGRLVIPAPLVAPPGRACPACVVVLDTSRCPRRAHPGALTRLARLLVRSAAASDRSTSRAQPVVRRAMRSTR